VRLFFGVDVVVLRTNAHGKQYKPGFDDAYITWISDDKVAWTLNAAGVGASNVVEISARPIPQEPMVRAISE
jgi:hypothetical protein